MTVNRSSLSSRAAHRAPRVAAIPGETEIARAARQLAVDLMRRVDHGAERFETWWKAQVPRTRVGLAVVAVILSASLLNVVEMRIVQSTATAPAVAPKVLTSEAAPADAGKMWAVVKTWQGTGMRDVETFTVSDHWRVDWVFTQTQALGQMQVYIYSADGKLLNVATNVQASNTDTSFWTGAGTYVLKVNSTGGDWKLAVQDLH